MLLRLRVAFRKEFIQFVRAKALIVLVLYTFAEIANCGWALTMDVRNLSLLVVDQDQSLASRSLGERFRIAPYFDYRLADGAIDPTLALDRGEASLVVVIPPGFARALDRGEAVRVQLLADGTYSNIGQLAIGYANAILQRHSADVQSDWAMRRGVTTGVPSVVDEAWAWYIPGLQYDHFLMISMLGISVLLLGMLLPAAIVREKEAGTIEQLLVTPLRPVEFILAKLVPMGLLMVVGLAIGLLEGWLLFGVPVRGSLALFFGLSLLMFFASMGLGTYIGAVTHNLLQTLLLTFALLFPMAFLSGSVAPVENMVPAMQWLAYLSPLRYYLPILNGILVKGVGLTEVAPYAAALGLYGLFLLGLGVRRFRRGLAG